MCRRHFFVRVTSFTSYMTYLPFRNCAVHMSRDSFTCGAYASEACVSSSDVIQVRISGDSFTCDSHPTLPHAAHMFLKYAFLLMTSFAYPVLIHLQQSPDTSTCSAYVTVWTTCFLGCDNGIGGFHENLVNFRDLKLPDFLRASKMRLKKCSA